MAGTKTAFVSVGFGVTSFIIAFALGSALTAGTGIPLAGGLLNGVLVSMVLTIGMQSMNRFGVGIIMWLTLSICAIPTTTLGPQGFYKVIIGIVAGLIWDTIYRLLKYNRFGLYFGALVAAFSIMGILILALSYGFGENASEALKKYTEAIYGLLAINGVVTLVGVGIGDYMHTQRLSKLAVFKNLKKIPA